MFASLRHVGRAGVASGLFLLAGCTTYQGVAEFTLYQDAFAKTYATSTAILDQLAVQERKLFLRRHSIRGEADAVAFNPALAAYYTDAVDPPGTAAFRRSLDTVKTYNDLLYGLASGQTAASLTSKLAELEVNVGKAAASAASLVTFSGAAQLVELTAVAKGLDAAFTRLKPFVQVALSRRSRDAFRHYLTSSYPTVRQILVALKDGTVKIFPVLTAETVRRARTDLASGALTPAEIAKIEGYRKILADWVILIETTIRALDHANVAATAAPTLVASAATFNRIAVDLETTSQAARKHLAEIAAQ